jgi:Phage integrase, N-terminal SAM-like domain
MPSEDLLDPAPERLAGDPHSRVTSTIGFQPDLTSRSASSRNSVTRLFAKLAEELLADYPVAKELKRSTRRAYEVIVRKHLIDAFGTLQVGEIDVERIERYLAVKARAGYSSGSRNRQLNVLSLIMRAAVRRHLVATNAVALVDRPREKRRRRRILTPEEVAALERAFDELIAEAAEADKARDHDDLTMVRRLFLLHLTTGVRQRRVCDVVRRPDFAGGVSSWPIPRARSCASRRHGFGMHSTLRRARQGGGRSISAAGSPTSCSSTAPGQPSTARTSPSSRTPAPDIPSMPTGTRSCQEPVPNGRIVTRCGNAGRRKAASVEAAGVGFEPTDDLRRQRFSRPPRSTAPAPRRVR